MKNNFLKISFLLQQLSAFSVHQSYNRPVLQRVLGVIENVGTELYKVQDHILDIYMHDTSIC